MEIAIMQPYFLPYIGYWQLMNSVDKFVVYDNIEFTKDSWIRRNRILLHGEDHLFTIPVKNDSDYLNINERYLGANYKRQKKKILNKIKMSYSRSPYFEDVFEMIKRCFEYDNNNLFEFVFNSIKEVKEYLEIDTQLIVSSKIKMDHSLNGEERVIETCKQLNADIYRNPIGGLKLYKKNNFNREGIELEFLESKDTEYNQFIDEFIPKLSIIDVLMFNSKEKVKNLLDEYNIQD